MFERYAERARRVLFFARWEASQLGSLGIEPVHILLGLLRDKGSLTRSVFARAGLSYESGHAHARLVIGAREQLSTAVEIPFSPGTKRILQYSAEEADRFHHNAIGTEHLLLGVLRENDSIAAALLKQHGLTLDTTRESIRQLLADGVRPSWQARDEVDAVSANDKIEAIKASIQQFGSHAKPGAQELIARIVRELEELIQFFE
jgi:ATP-dependent Clp protease ATP-binding subunit ClpC